MVLWKPRPQPAGNICFYPTCSSGVLISLTTQTDSNKGLVLWVSFPSCFHPHLSLGMDLGFDSIRVTFAQPLLLTCSLLLPVMLLLDASEMSLPLTPSDINIRCTLSQ